MKILIVFLCLIKSISASSNLMDGSSMSLWWTVPFAGILLSLALLPSIAEVFWEKNMGKISIFWGLATVAMIFQQFDVHTVHEVVLETYLHHFIPFIIFILSLYVLCGGIKINITGQATPITNTLFLTIGTLLASCIGTTGAAILLIKVFIDINSNRINKSYLVIFFIFLVCNIGGSLSAVGDPPLFLGFLKGIDFFWPTYHLLLPFVVISMPLLCVFYIIDCYYFKKENHQNSLFKISKIKLEGYTNLVLLVFAVASIIMSGVFKFSEGIKIGSVTITYNDFIRDVFLLFLACISFKYCNKDVRIRNNFSWEPLLEVFKVFAAIFITVAPVIVILKAGDSGAFSGLFKLVNTVNGPDNKFYFWITGLLSAFLDNAPTYLVFFNLAGGDANNLMNEMSGTLIAISCGAVFMGALTYIGNAPNFMVRAIAEEKKVKMPSFFGYILWSISILLPLFLLISLLL